MTDEPNIATKDRLGDYDAIETAKPGEPLFPLQGGDPFAPPTVLHWAGLQRAAGMAESDPAKAKHMLNKASDAELVAWAMRSYQAGEVQPDPESGRARYNDAVLPTVDQDDLRAARRGLIQSVAILNNAIAQGSEVVETLARHRVHPEQEVRLREAVAIIQEVAFAIEPRRGMERS